MATYSEVKAAAIDVIDDFTEDDVAANYAPHGTAKYNAKTTLVKIYINAPVLATMYTRFNKKLRQVCGDDWNDVGAINLVDKKTIADIIKLACAQSGTFIPAGEPT